MLGIAIGGLGAAIANPLQAWEILSGTWDDMKKAADNTNAALDRILNAGNSGVNPTVKRLTDITVAADKATAALGKTGAEEKKPVKLLKKLPRLRPPHQNNQKAKAALSRKIPQKRFYGVHNSWVSTQIILLLSYPLKQAAHLAPASKTQSHLPLV